MLSLITPYGGTLVDLLVGNDDRALLIEKAKHLPSIQISQRSVCDLEMLAIGGFSPLDRFMARADYTSVVNEMRLADGIVFPIPITLPVERSVGLVLDREVALRDPRNHLLAVMTIEEIFEWSRREFAERVAGTEDPRHPLVAELPHWGDVNISGRLRLIDLPQYFDFPHLRLAPVATRQALSELGKSNIVAFQTRNPIHRVHEELMTRAADAVNGTLFLHPAVGMTKPGDVDLFTRVRTYEVFVDKYSGGRKTLLSLLPVAMRMAGPREAVWHAIIRRNYGANHFIVGRSHACPGSDSKGEPFYPPEAANHLAEKYADEIGVQILSSAELRYSPNEDQFVVGSSDESVGPDIAKLSGSRVREFLAASQKPPEWITRPEIADILQDGGVRRGLGVCIWMTGLSGAGKSATAEALTTRLNQLGRSVTLLDGDVVRTHLSKGLGFSREDRETNMLRIGFVAAEVVRHGGIAVCAAISPFRSTRNQIRQMVGPNFIEIFVDTSLEVCESRDTKGMYEAARRGKIKNFTGIDDPYEAPECAEVTVGTVNSTLAENVATIMKYLEARRLISPERLRRTTA